MFQALTPIAIEVWLSYVNVFLLDFVPSIKFWLQDEGEPPDLLELLLKQAEKAAPSREPRLLSLDLRPTVQIAQRGLLPCHSVPFLNALMQTLLASSLMPLLAQVFANQSRSHLNISITEMGRSDNWSLKVERSPRKLFKPPQQNRLFFCRFLGPKLEKVAPRAQRPAYSCFMQLAVELSSGQFRLPADAGLLLEPLLRRFERGKAVQEAPAFPGPWKVPGLADMWLGFKSELQGQLVRCCNLGIKT